MLSCGAATRSWSCCAVGSQLVVNEGSQMYKILKVRVSVPDRKSSGFGAGVDVGYARTQNIKIVVVSGISGGSSACKWHRMLLQSNSSFIGIGKLQKDTSWSSVLPTHWKFAEHRAFMCGRSGHKKLNYEQDVAWIGAKKWTAETANVKYSDLRNSWKFWIDKNWNNRLRIWCF